MRGRIFRTEERRKRGGLISDLIFLISDGLGLISFKAIAICVAGTRVPPLAAMEMSHRAKEKKRAASGQEIKVHPC